MYTKSWQVIKDDSKRTFENCGQAGNTNSFTNQTVAMQRVGMNVSCITPPVTNAAASKDSVKVTGYTKENGLYERLMKEYKDITMRSIDEFE